MARGLLPGVNLIPSLQTIVTQANNLLAQLSVTINSNNSLDVFHSSLTSALSSTSTLTFHVVQGDRRGGRFKLLPVNDPTPVDNVLTYQRTDGRKLTRDIEKGTYKAEWFNITGDGTADDTTNLNNLIIYAGQNGGTYQFEPTMRLKVTNSVNITFTTKPFTLSGNGAKIEATFVDKAVVYGNVAKNVTIKDFTVTMTQISDAHPTGHDNDPRRTVGGHGFIFYFSEDITIENVLVKNVSSIGMVFAGVNGYKALGNTIYNTMADGIHSTHNSRNGTIANNRLMFTGDDAIPIISYKTYGSDPIPMCENITITGNNIYSSCARGIVVGGGRQITASGNTVELTSAAGLLAHGEDAQFNCHPVQNVVFAHNTVLSAGKNVNSVTGAKASLMVSEQTGTNSHNVLFEGNICNSPADHQAIVSGVTGVRIVNNIFSGAIANNSIVAGGAGTLDVSSNQFNNLGAVVNLIFAINQRNGVTLNGNTVTGNKGKVFYLTGVTNATINGNTLIDSGTLVFDVISSTHVMIENNNIINAGTSATHVSSLLTSNYVTFSGNRIRKHSSALFTISVEPDCTAINILSNDLTGHNDKLFNIPPGIATIKGNIGFGTKELTSVYTTPVYAAGTYRKNTTGMPMRVSIVGGTVNDVGVKYNDGTIVAMGPGTRQILLMPDEEIAVFPGSPGPDFWVWKPAQ